MQTAFAHLAARYDRWYRTPLGELVDFREREAIFALAAVRTGELALDVGCGTGLYALELARRGAIALGVDPSPAMLAVAHEKARQQGVPAAFTIGCAEDLPFPDATFSLAICVTALEFVSSPGRAIAEMARTLRPGGRLVVGVLNNWSLWGLARRLERKPSVYQIAHFFSPPELVALLRPHGAVAWRTAVFVPPWYVRPNPRLARALESIGPPLLKPFGAFVAARVKKEG